MTSNREMGGLAVGVLLNSMLTISTVFGCGQLPQGRERSMTFNVTGFSLPIAMVYSDNTGVRSRFPGMSQSQQAATTFVTRLIMQSVNDVLEQEGRNALLLPGVISLILQQLTVQINYVPLKCDVAFVDVTSANQIQANMDHCIIIANTITATCNNMMANQNCQLAVANTVQSIPPQHLTISGSLRIANPIMADWSREMWQSILNRVARNLASGSFGANFLSATVTVG